MYAHTRFLKCSSLTLFQAEKFSEFSGKIGYATSIQNFQENQAKFQIAHKYFSETRDNTVSNDHGFIPMISKLLSKHHGKFLHMSQDSAIGIMWFILTDLVSLKFSFGVPNVVARVEQSGTAVDSHGTNNLSHLIVSCYWSCGSSNILHTSVKCPSPESTCQSTSAVNLVFPWLFYSRYLQKAALQAVSESWARSMAGW